MYTHPCSQVPKIHREFSMGVASVADSSGIFVAAVISEWVIHPYICNKFVNPQVELDYPDYDYF